MAGQFSLLNHVFKGGLKMDDNLLSAEKKQIKGRFVPGRSGNPAGRPRGLKGRTSLRSLLEASGAELVEKCVTLALGGDVAALRLCLDRVLPSLRPVEQPTTFSLPTENLSDQGRQVLACVARGELSPGQGAQILSSIGTLARVVEVSELIERIELLEAKDGKSDKKG